MKIIPRRDLKNTVEIERLCKEENGPVFVMKNGYGRLIVMDLDYYQKHEEEYREALLVQEGYADLKSGRTGDFDSAIRELEEKYGIAIQS